MGNLGIVIIGRNEGERLKACLRSVGGAGCPIVYVDSGSMDGSVRAARQFGAAVVELEPPFTAARGRNAGLARLVELEPELKYVQFIDGDVELAPDWLETGRSVLNHRPDVAVVCGRLRERYLEKSIYNRLCNAEWDRPAGETTACGGIAMMRVEPLKTGGGFREDLIAGEEPELCLRLRREGWKVMRLKDHMGWHDAAMIHFSQWWRRSVRAGYGYAQGAWVHRASPERYRRRELLSIGLWGAAVPCAAVGAAPVTGGLSLAALAVYPAQFARVMQSERRSGRASADAGLVAAFMLVGKFAQLQGTLRFTCDLVRGKGSHVIEYKGTDARRRESMPAAASHVPAGR